MIWIEVHTPQGRSTMRVNDMKTVIVAMRYGQPLASENRNGDMIVIGPEALRNAVAKVCGNA